MLPLWKKISAGGMRSSEISFFILAGTIALIFGFASLPRGFIAVGIVAVIAALAAMILLEELERAPRGPCRRSATSAIDPKADIQPKRFVLPRFIIGRPKPFSLRLPKQKRR